MTPSQAITVALTHKDWTRKKLADALDCAPSSLARYQNGEREMPYDMGVKALEIAAKVKRTKAYKEAAA